MSGQQNHGFADDSRTDSYGSFSGAINSTEQLAPKRSITFPAESKEVKKSIEAGEYDPYIFREVEHPTTNTETLIHLLKGSFGTGILAMPLAFYHSGYVLGIVATIVIGIICTHCIHMLIRCEYEVCKRQKISRMSYPLTAQACFKEGPPFMQKFSNAAPHIVNVFLLIYQLGTGTVYTVFIGENIQGVLEAHGIEVKEGYVMLAWLLPLILLNYVRNLKFLAPFSTLANFITVVSFGIIAYYMFEQDFSIEKREPFGNYRNYPLFFGTVMFALEAIGVIMPLENEMKTPQRFERVLNIGMVTIVCMYTAMGFFGYIAYGKDVGGSISFTIGNDIPAQVCKIMLSLAIFISHGLQMYPAIDTVWNDYLLPRLEKNQHQLLLEYVTRTIMVVFCFGLAVSVPYIDLFISLFGAFSLSALGLIIPAILDLSCYWYDLKGTSGRLRISKDCFIILVGFFGFVVGTATSLEKIIEKLSPEA